MIAISLVCLGLAVACGPSQSAKQTDAKIATPAEEGGVKRYPLSGRIVSVDKANQSLNIAGDAIPGFMGAMTMSYQVKDTDVLTKASAGDQIEAEIVVGNDGAYLQNIVFAREAPSPKPTK
jgi:Cu/Ag efflux protein CusF